MMVAATIREKLTAAFEPDELLVEDESAKHAGHSGARVGGQTHFNVRIVAKSFEGQSRVERQRAFTLHSPTNSSRMASTRCR